MDTDSNASEKEDNVADCQSQVDTPVVTGNGHSNSMTATPDDSPSRTTEQDTTSIKRERKKVQRLSEVLSKAHEEKAQERLKAAQSLTEGLKAGKGTPLGEIPLIEYTIRRTKPVDLKALHYATFGRPGTTTEARSNLRKFCGFPFGEDSKEFTNKSNLLNQRNADFLREALRVLHLEVTGTREKLVSRLMEFLLEPKASMVKYKGKLPPKSGGRGRKPSKPTKEPRSKSSKSATSSKAESSVGSILDSNAASHEQSSLSEASDDDEVAPVKSSAKKPARKRKATKRIAVLDDSEGDSSAEAMDVPPAKSAKKPKVAKKEKTKVHEQEHEKETDEEDVALSKLAPQKSSMPTDEVLRECVVNLLKGANLEETSLKNIRNQVFSKYPDVDLSDKKEFINSTVKEYLALS